MARAKSDYRVFHLFALLGTHRHALVLHLPHSTDPVNKSGSGHARGKITLTGGRVTYVGISHCELVYGTSEFTARFCVRK